MLEKEQETNECTSTMQGLTEILEGSRSSLKIDGEEPTKSRGRLTESQYRIQNFDAGDGSGNGGGGYTSGNPQHEISLAKGGTTLGQSRSKLEESPPHDFGLQQQVQQTGCRGQWNGSQEARKHNENSDVQEALELQDKLRDFNVLWIGGGEMEVVQEDERVPMEI